MANMPPPQTGGAPQEGSGMAGPQGPQPQGPDLQSVMQQQNQGTAQAFDKMQQGAQLLGKARAMMDKLVAMGDNVTGEDAIEMGGQLVGAGLSATAVASLFASMPSDGGEALASWVQQQDEGLKQREAQMKMALKSTQHHMGVNAFRMLAAAHHGETDGGA